MRKILDIIETARDVYLCLIKAHPFLDWLVDVTLVIVFFWAIFAGSFFWAITILALAVYKVVSEDMRAPYP